MNESRGYYATWNKSDWNKSGRPKPYDFTYVCESKKQNKQNETKIDSQRTDRQLLEGREVEIGEADERD